MTPDFARRLLALEAHLGVAALEPEFAAPRPEVIDFAPNPPLFAIVEQEDGETAAQLAARVAQVRARLGPAAIVMAIEGQPFEVYDGRDGGRRGEEPPPGWAGLSLLPGASLAAARAAQRAEGRDGAPLEPAQPEPAPAFPDWRVRVDAETGRKLLVMHPDAPVSTPEDVAQATANAAYQAALEAMAKKGSN